MKKIIPHTLLAILYTLLAKIVFAQGPQTVNDVLVILNRLVNWMFTLLLVLATIFVILAGYKFLTGAGEPEKINEAKRQLLYAAIAIAVGLVARGIEFLVRQLIGGF